MSSSNDTDTDPARQDNSNLKLQIDQHQLRYYRVYADIGECILAVITGAIFLKLCRRVSLLIDGAWLPGMGDCKVIAALTDKSHRSIEDLVSDNPKTKHRIGKQVYYRFADMPTTGEPPTEVAPVKRKPKQT